MATSTSVVLLASGLVNIIPILVLNTVSRISVVRSHVLLAINVKVILAPGLITKASLVIVIVYSGIRFLIYIVVTSIGIGLSMFVIVIVAVLVAFAIADVLAERGTVASIELTTTKALLATPTMLAVATITLVKAASMTTKTLVAIAVAKFALCFELLAILELSIVLRFAFSLVIAIDLRLKTILEVTSELDLAFDIEVSSFFNLMVVLKVTFDLRLTTILKVATEFYLFPILEVSSDLELLSSMAGTIATMSRTEASFTRTKATMAGTKATMAGTSPATTILLLAAPSVGGRDGDGCCYSKFDHIGIFDERSVYLF